MSFLGHWQTIWPALVLPRLPKYRNIRYRRERWLTNDQDFIDVDFLDHHTAADAPLLVLFHGLEGSSRSHYALQFARMAKDKGWRYAVPHFRGCSGELNWAPRAYHSGDHEEIDWILRRFKAEQTGNLYALGVSLGGNALMRWAGEHGHELQSVMDGVVSVCSPLDLSQSGQHLGRGLNKYIYTPMFLRSMKPRAQRKWQQYPGLFDVARVNHSRDLYDFDNAFTAPLHGFKDTDDYWQRASAKPHLLRIAVPALAINALNDPFIPSQSLPTSGEVGAHVKLWQPKKGGHVGLTQYPLVQWVHDFFTHGQVPESESDHG